jgi:hypothetical protein
LQRLACPALFSKTKNFYPVKYHFFFCVMPADGLADKEKFRLSAFLGEMSSFS